MPKMSGTFSQEPDSPEKGPDNLVSLYVNIT